MILGVDFTCAPRASKGITVAFADWDRGVLLVDRLARLADFASFEKLLADPGPWIGGFDFPFGLPRELIRDLGWPRDWRALVAHCEAMTRADFRSVLDAYRATRPQGRKYAHRKTDGPAGSSSPMKLVNPPVALMFHEGAHAFQAERCAERRAQQDSLRAAQRQVPPRRAREVRFTRVATRSTIRRLGRSARRRALRGPGRLGIAQAPLRASARHSGLRGLDRVGVARSMLFREGRWQS